MGSKTKTNRVMWSFALSSQHSTVNWGDKTLSFVFDLSLLCNILVMRPVKARVLKTSQASWEKQSLRHKDQIVYQKEHRQALTLFSMKRFNCPLCSAFDKSISSTYTSGYTFLCTNRMYPCCFGSVDYFCSHLFKPSSLLYWSEPVNSSTNPHFLFSSYNYM